MALKSWAKSLPNPANKRKKIQCTLEIHNLQDETTGITKEILDKEAQLQQNYPKACLAEEEYWRLNSCSLWLKAGDKNSSLFHKRAQVRKCTNSISEIKDCTTIHKDNANIKKATSLHFKILNSEDINLDQNSDMMDVFPSLISAEMNHLLEAKVTKNEVNDALFAMDPDKAPRPDGFSARFLQICWSIVENDLYKMVLKSQVWQKIGGSTNSSFLALIPKEKGANSFNKFHPISLCNIGYKLITKVIANRLKLILPKIIPESQGGFIQGRQIVDNFILVQEVIHSSLSRNEKCMVVKLDLANAFDRVKHIFLLKVLHKLGFGEKFINWIRACILEPWFHPLVNGKVTDFFQSHERAQIGVPSLTTSICSSSLCP